MSRSTYSGGIGSPEWLPYRLAEAPRVWATEDSLSMVYEALSAGAAVGLLTVPRRGSDRVTREMTQLIADGVLTSYEDWRQRQALTGSGQPLNEAARCAQWISEHLLSSN